MTKRYRTPTRTVVSKGPPRVIREPAKPPKTWPNNPRNPTKR